MELKFIDLETAKRGAGLMNDEVEENFNDMRVRSVIEEAQRAFKVEKHAVNSFQKEILEIITRKTELRAEILFKRVLEGDFEFKNGFEG